MIKNEKEHLKKVYLKLQSNLQLKERLKIMNINTFETNQNVFKNINGEIGFVNCDDDWADWVYELVQKNMFNIMFLDYSIMTFEYTFNNKNKIIKHRLLYIKDPTTEEGPIIGLRCDYDPRNHEDLTHPKAHVTFLKTNNRLMLNRHIYIDEFIYFCRVFLENNHFENSEALLVNSASILSDIEKKHVHIRFPLD